MRPSKILRGKSLNPCFSGTYSRSVSLNEKQKYVVSLNPCFSGTYSRSWESLELSQQDVCLNPCFSGTYSRRDCGS